MSILSQAIIVKDNSAVNPAHAEEKDCKGPQDSHVHHSSRMSHKEESCSTLVQPIAALADLPLPNPNFGYRSHFSVDGGKSGFVVVRSAVSLCRTHDSCGSSHSLCCLLLLGTASIDLTSNLCGFADSLQACIHG